MAGLNLNRIEQYRSNLQNLESVAIWVFRSSLSDNPAMVGPTKRPPLVELRCRPEHRTGMTDGSNQKTCRAILHIQTVNSLT